MPWTMKHLVAFTLCMVIKNYQNLLLYISHRQKQMAVLFQEYSEYIVKNWPEKAAISNTDKDTQGFGT